MAARTSSDKPARLEIEERLTADEKQARRSLLFFELRTSLWAPVSVFGLVFLVYLGAVELHTPLYEVLQPALKGFGLLMIAWHLGLVLWRGAAKGVKTVAKERHAARELRREVEALTDRHRAKIAPGIREKLLALGAALERARIRGDLDPLKAELARGNALVASHLSAWRRNPSLEFVTGLLKALAIALLIRAVILEPFKIPTGSMIPTLEIGDQIFVNKFIYGVRLPFINRVPFVVVRPPERGDVIVFENPVDGSKDFIKRVVAIPGDTIWVADEVIYVNGKAQPRKSLSASYLFYNKELGGAWRTEEAAMYEEDLDGHRHRTLQLAGHPKAGLMEGPWTVPAQHVFVMGDNRDNSLDSRYGLGDPGRGVQFVPYGHIKGKAMVIWLSLAHGGIFEQFFGGTGIRTDRFFLPVR